MSLWSRIRDEYDVDDAAGIELLTLACESLDRAAAIGELIDHAGEGSVHSETGIVRSNPMVKDELACRAFVSKCIERLGLNSEIPRATGGRPAGSFITHGPKTKAA